MGVRLKFIELPCRSTFDCGCGQQCGASRPIAATQGERSAARLEVSEKHVFSRNDRKVMVEPATVQPIANEERKMNNRILALCWSGLDSLHGPRGRFASQAVPPQQPVTQPQEYRQEVNGRTIPARLFAASQEETPFADSRAKRVGDIVVVKLVENTKAQRAETERRQAERQQLQRRDHVQQEQNRLHSLCGIRPAGRYRQQPAHIADGFRQ